MAFIFSLKLLTTSVCLPGFLSAYSLLENEKLHKNIIPGNVMPPPSKNEKQQKGINETKNRQKILTITNSLNAANNEYSSLDTKSKDINKQIRKHEITLNDLNAQKQKLNYHLQIIEYAKHQHKKQVVEINAKLKEINIQKQAWKNQLWKFHQQNIFIASKFKTTIANKKNDNIFKNYELWTNFETKYYEKLNDKVQDLNTSIKDLRQKQASLSSSINSAQHSTISVNGLQIVESKLKENLLKIYSCQNSKARRGQVINAGATKNKKANIQNQISTITTRDSNMQQLFETLSQAETTIVEQQGDKNYFLNLQNECEKNIETIKQQNPQIIQILSNSDKAAAIKQAQAQDIESDKQKWKQVNSKLLDNIGFLQELQYCLNEILQNQNQINAIQYYIDHQLIPQYSKLCSQINSMFIDGATITNVLLDEEEKLFLISNKISEQELQKNNVAKQLDKNLNNIKKTQTSILKSKKTMSFSEILLKASSALS